ncbi:MAG: YlmH/Sll1252 family protein [Sedimentibacter sp.]|uniref:YlmH family RNA-binding protein n=1 Tax=Sedimentibacter sp. TaxID=1960295 RepID=UPI00315937D6
MKDFEKYYDFIKDEETKNTVRKIADKASYVEKNFITAVTEFTNPYAAELCIPIIKNYDVKFELFPSYEHCERKVFILYPDYMGSIDRNEYVAALRIMNRSKFKDLSHKDYLGSIMSLGIDRNRTGDIYVHEDFADVVMHKDIAEYVHFSLELIGRNKVETQILKAEETAFKEQQHELIMINASSLRLDSLVKNIANKSREDSSDMVKSGLVKVNFKVEEKPSAEVKEGDMISIAKYGRFKIHRLSGITKSGKNKIEIKHYI